MTAVGARVRMACDEVESLLSPWVDGELLEDELELVRAHVHVCAPCRQRHGELQQVKAALARAGRESALPPAVVHRLTEAIAGEAQRVRRQRLRSFLAAGAGAAALVAGVMAVALASPGWPPWSAPASLLSRVSPTSPAPPGLLAADDTRETRPLIPMVAAVAERHALDLPVDVASPDPRRVAEFLTARMGPLPLVVPGLERHGWGLQGARIIDVAARRAAQLVYRGGYGQRLSVMVLPDPDRMLAAQLPAAAAGMQARTPQGIGVHVIARGPSLYAFVSDVDAARLVALGGVLGP